MLAALHGKRARSAGHACQGGAKRRASAMREWDLDLGKASRRHAHARQTAPTEAHVALQLWITRSSERCSARWCRALPIPRHARAHALHRRLGLKTFGPRSQVCPALGPPCAPARTSLPCHAVDRALTHTRIPAQRRPATSWCFGTADVASSVGPRKKKQTDRPWHGRELTKTRAVKHPQKAATVRSGAELCPHAWPCSCVACCCAVWPQGLLQWVQLPWMGTL